MIGWIGALALAAASENSSAAKRLPVSVSATAGMPAAAQSSGSVLTGTAPSSSE